MRCFWSYNDDVAQHVHRYTRQDYRRLAAQCGYEVCSTRYFMFLLSPLLLLSRLKAPNVSAMTPDEIRALVERTHLIPSRPVNGLLRFIFALETPLGHWLPFPWGTSVLAVLRKGEGAE